MSKQILESIQIFVEGQNEDRAKSLLKKADKETAYDSLLEITKPHNNKNKHLPALVQFYISGNDSSTIKSYYDRFIKNDKINTTVIDKMSFEDFEQLVDSHIDKTTDDLQNIDDTPIYEDANVKIFLGDEKNKCIKYGQGKKYGFCIARIGTGNLYHAYRSRGATFYFIYFKNKESQGDLPEEVVVIHAYPNDTYQINYASPNKDHPITKEEILSKIPSLSEAFKDGAIKYVPHTEQEKYIYDNINHKGSILDLKNVSDMMLWVEIGKRVDSLEWKQLLQKLPKNAVEDLLAQYIEVGLDDIKDEILHPFPNLAKRYKSKLMQRVLINTSMGEIYGRSRHETLLFDDLTVKLINNPNDDSLKDFKDAVIQSQNASKFIIYQFVQRSKEPPEEFINVIKNPEYAVLILERYKDTGMYSKMPKKLLDLVATDVNASMRFYNVVYNPNQKIKMPQNIIDSMIHDPVQATRYAREEFFNPQKVPKNVLESISKNALSTKHYIRDVLEYKNVPDILVKTMAKDPSDAFIYAIRMLRTGQEIPNIIVKSINSRQDTKKDFEEIMSKENEKPMTESINQYFNNKLNKLFLESETPKKQTIDEEFPKAGDTIGDLTIGNNIPNKESISASFNDYEILDGIRIVSMEGWNPEKTFYAQNDIDRSKKLAEAIKQNGFINPLIVALDSENEPYILEGIHRFYALHLLGINEFPALMVKDLDDTLNEAKKKKKKRKSRKSLDARNIVKRLRGVSMPRIWGGYGQSFNSDHSSDGGDGGGDGGGGGE
jgi:hypothetical protein